MPPNPKLLAAQAYLREHNIYATDPGTLFLYTPSEDGSAILAPTRDSPESGLYHPDRMAGLPSQRKAW